MRLQSFLSPKTFEKPAFGKGKWFLKHWTRPLMVLEQNKLMNKIMRELAGKLFWPKKHPNFLECFRTIIAHSPQTTKKRCKCGSAFFFPTIWRTVELQIWFFLFDFSKSWAYLGWWNLFGLLCLKIGLSASTKQNHFDDKHFGDKHFDDKQLPNLQRVKLDCWTEGFSTKKTRLHLK